MASTSRSKNKICCGFGQDYTPFVSIGRSLTEGYTELLNTRIFNREGISGRYSIYRGTITLTAILKINIITILILLMLLYISYK